VIELLDGIADGGALHPRESPRATAQVLQLVPSETSFLSPLAATIAAARRAVIGLLADEEPGIAWKACDKVGQPFGSPLRF